MFAPSCLPDVQFIKEMFVFSCHLLFTRGGVGCLPVTSSGQRPHLISERVVIVLVALGYSEFRICEL
jgi:hypothetical protein